MKAIVCRAYGPPEGLVLEELPTPTPTADEVRVRVHAASVNSWDRDRLTGTPRVYRLMSGLTRPRDAVPGADIAGVVDAVGGDVTDWQPGDEVFGDLSASGWGAFAEYVCAPAHALAKKPVNIGFEEAAAMPQAAVMALQGIRDYGETQPGDRVLVNGGGGGVGTFAIQLARHFGAEVTGVDSGPKLDVMRAAGAADVVDYTREDFADRGVRYDLILDCEAHRPMSDYLRVLSDAGRYVMVGGAIPRFFGLLAAAAWQRATGQRRKLAILAHAPNRDLDGIRALAEAGELRSMIDSRFPLSETAAALRRFIEGKVCGKAVITM